MQVDSDIINFLKSQPDGVILSLSLGKDSLTCLSILKQHDIPFVPFYFYQCPELQFIQESVDFYEKFFDISIIQLPHPMLFDALRHQDFQTLDRAEMLADISFPKYDFNQLIRKYSDSVGLDLDKLYSIVGMRASESFNRRMIFRKFGSIHHHKRKIFPIWNWTTKNVRQYLQDQGIPLSKDYEIWHRSWDGLKYQFTWDVKKHFPDDWNTLCEYFPLLPLELLRYEFNHKHMES